MVKKNLAGENIGNEKKRARRDLRSGCGMMKKEDDKNLFI